MKSILISNKLHKQIKILSIQNDTTIGRWVESALQNRVDSLHFVPAEDKSLIPLIEDLRKN